MDTCYKKEWEVLLQTHLVFTKVHVGTVTFEQKQHPYALFRVTAQS